jgi:hypothetical protein
MLTPPQQLLLLLLEWRCLLAACMDHCCHKSFGAGNADDAAVTAMYKH